MDTKTSFSGINPNLLNPMLRKNVTFPNPMLLNIIIIHLAKKCILSMWKWTLLEYGRMSRNDILSWTPTFHLFVKATINYYICSSTLNSNVFSTNATSFLHHWLKWNILRKENLHVTIWSYKLTILVSLWSAHIFHAIQSCPKWSFFFHNKK